MPTPKKGESKQEFISRCVPIRHGEHPNEDNKQSVAVCFSIWKEYQKKAVKAELEEETAEWQKKKKPRKMKK